MTSITLNQVVSRLEKLAVNHKQINHFYFGDAFEWFANGEIKYPACFIDFTTGSIDKASRLTSYDFDIWFCDLADVATNARRNEIEVFSDLTRIAEDYRAMLSYTGFYDTWVIEDNSPLNYFKHDYEDIVVGMKMSVRISTAFASDRCQVPSLSGFEGDPRTFLLNDDGQALLSDDGTPLKS